MTTTAILVALAALGVDAGYEPAADGNLEYIVQIEPQLVTPLAKGQDVTSELPRGLEVRHFRLTIGTGKLPRQKTGGSTTRNRFPTDGSQVPPGVEAQDVRVGYTPLNDQDGEYVIEIPPAALNDLNEHDLTGDIPANLAVTRLRVSTQPGSAQVDPPPANLPTIAQQPPPATAPQINPPPAGPTLATGAGGASGQGAGNPAEQGMEPLTALEQTELEHPDNDPNFQWPADPLAPSAAAGAGSPPPTQPQIKQSQFAGQNGGSPQGAAGRQRSNQSGPAQPAGNQDWPPQNTPTRGAGSPPPPGTVAYDHNAGAQQGQNRLNNLKNKSETLLNEAEEDLNAATKSWPWYALAITLLLFLSLGANVYMTWIAWDARNRSRQLLERFHAGELKLS